MTIYFLCYFQCLISKCHIFKKLLQPALENFEFPSQRNKEMTNYSSIERPWIRVIVVHWNYRVHQLLPPVHTLYTSGPVCLSVGTYLTGTTLPGWICCSRSPAACPGSSYISLWSGSSGWSRHGILYDSSESQNWQFRG